MEWMFKSTCRVLRSIPDCVHNLSRKKRREKKETKGGEREISRMNACNESRQGRSVCVSYFHISDVVYVQILSEDNN